MTLELGGKGAAIVTPDADLDAVAHGALFGVLLNAGQACESGTRLLVHASIYEPLLARMADIAGGLSIGNPLDPATSIGPMSNPARGSKVLGYIRSALAEGARLVCGGERVAVAGCEGGFFIAPTILADCNNRMRAVREEIFGPVLAVIKYEDVAAAIAIANDSDYGLSAGIWTGDVVTAQSIARRLGPGPSGSTTGTCCGRTHPSAVTSRAAWGARTASPGWNHFSRPRPSAPLSSAIRRRKP